MSTDVFNNFYDNPRKLAIYANMNCPGATSDSENVFTISDTEAKISNNIDVLTTVDLSDIKSSVNNWQTFTKTLKPNSITYISNDVTGESYKRMAFGKLLSSFFENSTVKLYFSVQYLKDLHLPCTEEIMVEGNNINEIIELLSDKLNNTYINITGVNDYVVFESTNLGLDFYIENIYIEYICEDDNRHVYYLEENENMFIPANKYINGAFKGIIINPKYPVYDKSINNEQKSLKYAHIIDRVNIFNPVFAENNETVYKKHIYNVFGNLSLVEEYNNCIILNNNNNEDDINDNWMNDDRDITIYNNMKLKRNHLLGLYGFCDYVSNNNLWQSFGEFYGVISSPDVNNEANKNLIPSMIIYNPNNFEVKINVMTWN